MRAAHFHLGSWDEFKVHLNSIMITFNAKVSIDLACWRFEISINENLSTLTLFVYSPETAPLRIRSFYAHVDS